VALILLVWLFAEAQNSWQEVKAMRIRTGFLASVCLLMCTLSQSGAQVVMGSVGAISMGIGGVKGQAYSLVETTTTVRTLGDGTTITSHQEFRRMRDAEGRQRTEGGVERDGVIQFDNVQIFDPIVREMINLSITTKTAHILHMPEPKPIDPARLAEMRAKAAENRANHPQPQPMNPPTVEKLGGQTVAGVYAEGTRTTRIIPAGKEGNDREIRTVTEVWTSPDLKIVVGRTTDDPRTGKSTMVVTDLSRGDPAASLFQVPADYKVIDQKPMGEAQ
jgi:hypothetical protein